MTSAIHEPKSGWHLTDLIFYAKCAATLNLIGGFGLGFGAAMSADPSWTVVVLVSGLLGYGGLRLLRRIEAIAEAHMREVKP